jgi:hypothetical protein
MRSKVEHKYNDSDILFERFNRALSHPASAAIIKYLLDTTACTCKYLVEKLLLHKPQFQDIYRDYGMPGGWWPVKNLLKHGNQSKKELAQCIQDTKTKNL